MEKKNYTYWQDENMWLGYLDDYPDYMTQGTSIEELQENLLDICFCESLITIKEMN